jgi:hypothetical protein
MAAAAAAAAAALLSLLHIINSCISLDFNL